MIVSLDAVQMRQHAIIENIQREELNIVELAQAYEELIEMHGLTQEELSSVVHKSRSHITNTLRLLQLSKKTRQALVDDKISAGHAKVLVGLSDKEQKIMVDSIQGQKLSVRETEQMVKSLKANGTPKKNKADETAATVDLDTLRKRFAQRGFLVRSASNRLTITFEDETQVRALLELLD